MPLKFGDWVMYEGKSYQYYDDCDDGMIAIKDPRYDWEFVHCYSDEVTFVRHADDATFEQGAGI